MGPRQKTRRKNNHGQRRTKHKRQSMKIQRRVGGNESTAPPPPPPPPPPPRSISMSSQNPSQQPPQTTQLSMSSQDLAQQPPQTTQLLTLSQDLAPPPSQTSSLLTSSQDLAPPPPPPSTQDDDYGLDNLFNEDTPETKIKNQAYEKAIANLLTTKDMYNKEIRNCFSNWKIRENKYDRDVKEWIYDTTDEAFICRSINVDEYKRQRLTKAIDSVAYGVYRNGQTQAGTVKVKLRWNDFHDFKGTPEAIDEYLKNCTPYVSSSSRRR